MGHREQYEAKKAAEKAGKERAREKQEIAAHEVEMAKRRFWNHPDKIVRYAGSLQLYTLALFAATLLLFGAAAVTAVILHNTDEKIGVQAGATDNLAQTALQQVAAMQGQLNEMKSAGKRTDALIDAANKSADAAQNSVALAERSAGQQMNQMKAYVFIELVNLINADDDITDIDPNKLQSAQVVIKNFGQTPAYSLVHIATLKFTDFPATTSVFLSTAAQSQSGSGPV